MTDREKEWADYQAWKKDFTGPIYFRGWDQWIVEFGWAVWQASRRAAIEESAKTCEALEARISAAMVDANERNGTPIDGGYLNACDDCADEIRALVTGDKNG